MRLFAASRIATTGCVVNTTPLTAPAGCVVTASCVAAPAPTVKLADVAMDSPDDAKLSVCAPTPVSARFANVATPFTAFTVSVPLNVPPPLAIATVTAAALLVRLLPASRIATTGCVEKAAPLTAPAGCVVITNCVAAPGVPVALNVTGLPLSPAAVAVTVFAPAVAPSVQLVNVAIPLAFVLTLAGVAGTITPPPTVRVNVTTTPLTGLPPLSVTLTLGGADTAVCTVVDCVTAEFAAIVVAAPVIPVALNVTGLPANEFAVAVTVFAPAAAPSVQLVSVATPLPFVTTDAGLAGAIAPPPLVSANVTVTPPTALPPASVTLTLGGAPTAVDTVAD